MKRNCINYLERISRGSDISTIKRIFNFREKNLSSLKKWLPKKKKLPLDISMFVKITKISREIRLDAP